MDLEKLIEEYSVPRWFNDRERMAYRMGVLGCVIISASDQVTEGQELSPSDEILLNQCKHEWEDIKKAMESNEIYTNADAKAHAEQVLRELGNETVA